MSRTAVCFVVRPSAMGSLPSHIIYCQLFWVSRNDSSSRQEPLQKQNGATYEYAPTICTYFDASRREKERAEVFLAIKKKVKAQTAVVGRREKHLLLRVTTTRREEREWDGYIYNIYMYIRTWYYAYTWNVNMYEALYIQPR